MASPETIIWIQSVGEISGRGKQVAKPPITDFSLNEIPADFSTIAIVQPETQDNFVSVMNA